MALTRWRRQAPARSQELIFLDTDDDLGTVRAKLESSPADEIFLVVPRRAATLRTPLEYRILARMAHELSTDVAIVSGDGNRRHLARQEGFRTRRSYRGVRHLAEAAGAPRSWRIGVPDWLPLPSLTALLVLGALAALVAAALLVALPIMRVSVTPASETVRRDVEIVVDPTQRTADPARGVLPGEALQYRFEVSGSVPTSGERNVGSDAARGEVVFANNTGSPVTLPARAPIVARNGARFLTDAEVRVPPYNYNTRAGVTAEQKGTAGNIGANQVANTDPPIPGLTVSNPRPMTGGSDRPGKVVAAADQARLKEQLLQRAREQALAEFQARGGAAKSVPSETLQIRVENENYQPSVEAEAVQLSGSIAASATAVAWDNQALNTLVQRMILGGFGSEYELPLDLLRLPPPEVLEFQNQRAKVRLRAEALVVRSVDPDPIEERLRGKSSNEARGLLESFPGLAGTPRVEISPNWAPRAYRIEIQVAAPK